MTTTPHTETHREQRSRSFGDLVGRGTLLLGLVSMVALFSIAAPESFPTLGNFKDIALSGAVLLVVAVPQAILVIMGYVDLSVGSVLALTSVTCGRLIAQSGWPAPTAVIAVLLLGALLGLVNGALVIALGLSGIVVTLGTLQLYRGVAQLSTESPPADFGSFMALLGRGSVAGIPILVIIAAIVFALGALVISRSPWGRHIYAIGVNRDAAFLSGIAVKRLPLIGYAASGVAASIGGVLYAARLDSASPGTLGVGFELDVLTAVLLGGVAFTGGRGTLWGVILGVLFLGVLKNGMLLLNVSSYWQSIASGCALIVAAGLDLISQHSIIRAATRPRVAAPVETLVETQ